MAFRSIKLHEIYQCQNLTRFFLAGETAGGGSLPPSCRDPDLFWWVRSSSGWPESEDSHPRHIGAGSSLRNKVVIRRLSYLDLFLMVASSSYMPKEIVAVSKQGTRGTGGDGQTSQSLLKSRYERRISLPV